MKKFFGTTIVLVVSAAFVCGPALAQAPAAPAAESAAPDAPATKVERSAKSKECSKEADAKGLHGKARKKFRDACKSGKTEADPQ